MSQPFTPNVELFIDVLARIERDPDHWNQGAWIDFVRVQNGRVDFCTTAGCFAGWACLIKGEGQPILLNRAILELTDDGETSGSRWLKPDGDQIDIDVYAYRLLGIGDPDPYETDASEEQCDAVTDLFDGSNTLDRLYQLSALICSTDEDFLRGRVRARVNELVAIDIKKLPRPVTQEGEPIHA